MEQELLSLVSAAPIMLLLSGNDIFDALRRVIKLTARSPVPHIVIPVLRPEDLLVLLFDCVNFKRSPGIGPSPATLTRAVPSQPSYIVVNFQQQNIAEQAFFEGTHIPSKAATAGDLDDGRTDSDDLPQDGIARSRISGWSRLVFQVPVNAAPIPYTIEDLLKVCSEYALNVAPAALPPFSLNLKASQTDDIAKRFSLLKSALPRTPHPVPAPLPAVRQTWAQRLMLKARMKAWAARSTLIHSIPQDFEYALQRQISGIYAHPEAEPRLRDPLPTDTSIEAPFRLKLSPNRFAAWAHALKPVAQRVSNPAEPKRIELWHTRLAVRFGGKIDELNDKLRTVRAIWTRDKGFDPNNPGAGPGHDNEPFRMSLDSQDRHEIVHLSSNYYIKHKVGGTAYIGEVTYSPLPIKVDRLMLTSLGAWMSLQGMWDPPSLLSIQQWRHLATTGRDHYVRVVYKGYLFPFGHRASLIKVTERKFHPNSRGGNIAYLRQRMFIVVQEPVKGYISTGLLTPAGHSYDLQMPFSRIRIKTVVTPNLDPPEKSDYLSIPSNPNSQGTLQSLFWPRVAGKDFRFTLVAEDFEGRTVELTAPLAFFDQKTEGNQALLGEVQKDFQDSPACENRRRRPLNGQFVTFADSTTPGDTLLGTEALVFGAEILDEGRFKDLADKLGTGDLPHFYPAVRKAEVLIPALRHLTGDNGVATIEYHDTYLRSGFDLSMNRGQVFAKLTDEPENQRKLDFRQQGDRSGALVQPVMEIKGISRLMGPVSDLDNITNGRFDPSNFFHVDAKMFGVIPLKDIIPGIDNSGFPDFVPKFVTETRTAADAFADEIDRLSNALGSLAQGADLQNDCSNLLSFIETSLNALPNPPNWDRLTAILNSFKTHLQTMADLLPNIMGLPADAKRALEKSVAGFQRDLADAAFVSKFKQAFQIPDELKVKFDWKTGLQNWSPSPSSKPLFIASRAGNLASLSISVEVQAQSNFKPEPAVDVSCSLSNFSIDLVGNIESFIILHFNRIEFFSQGGKKADVNVDMANIEFVGVLSFVDALRRLIPLDGFSDPPSLDVTREGISASYSLALPNIAFGAFSLQNLSLGAAFNLPFLGDPLNFRFNFCERHRPFLLTVSMFGGGGFFAIALSPDGVQVLEAAFEFGGSLSVNFGVASGGVCVMAGIYYKMEGGKASLAGYFRMGGEVEVLGMVSASIELYLDLNYEPSSGKCTGRATITVEVEVLFFSASVHISCERKFAGSNGDPSFRALMEPYPDPVKGPVKPWEEYCRAFA